MLRNGDNMNFQHLRYVVEVEKVKSISKAAKNLYMGQPNLSKAIKDLEKEIGITIFKRTSKGVEPTRSGVEFLHYANTILSQLDELQSLYTNKGEHKIKMNIAVPRASYVSDAFSRLVNSYQNEEPLDICFKELNPMDTINDVSSGESHVGVVRFQAVHENYFLKLFEENALQWEPLHEFDMVLLMHKEHPLSQLAEIPYHLLDGYIEVVHGDYQIPSLRFHEINKEAKLGSPSKRVYVYDRGSQFDLLETVEGAYMWVSPVPFELATRHGLVQKPCAAAGRSKDVVIYQDKKQTNEYERKFIEVLKQVDLV